MCPAVPGRCVQPLPPAARPGGFRSTIPPTSPRQSVGPPSRVGLVAGSLIDLTGLKVALRRPRNRNEVGGSLRPPKPPVPGDRHPEPRTRRRCDPPPRAAGLANLASASGATGFGSAWRRCISSRAPLSRDAAHLIVIDEHPEARQLDRRQGCMGAWSSPMLGGAYAPSAAGVPPRTRRRARYRMNSRPQARVALLHRSSSSANG